MKVIVGYTGYIEKEIEIDDAFAPCADPSLDNIFFLFYNVVTLREDERPLNKI